MPVNPVTWAMNNVALVLTAVVALIAVAWAYDAYEDADDKGDALKGFAGNAKQGTGGVLNLVLVSLVTLVGWAATTFGTAAEAIQFVLSVAPSFPVLSASVVTIGVGTLGLSSAIELQAVHFLGFGTLALLMAVAFKTDFGEVSLR